MAITFIAFIECVIDTSLPRKWHTVYGFPQIENVTPQSAVYKAIQDGAELSLVDLKNDRRYFSFKLDGEAHINNNILVFDSEWTEELAIDESKQLPKKKRMDES